MEIRQVDVAVDAQAAPVHAVIEASMAHERPWHRAETLAEALAGMRHDDPAEHREVWTAADGGDVLGVARLWLPLEDNPNLAYGQLEVRPDRRRRGVGTALMDQLVARALAGGRRTLLISAYAPEAHRDDNPACRFLVARGFTLGSTDIIRHLDLPVSDDLLSALAEESRPYYEDAYRIETHVDGIPEALRPSYCRVSGQLAVDAPSGTLEFEEEAITPARYAQWLDLEREQKRTRLTTLAVERSGGEVVAYTDLMLPAGAPDVVWQWGTMVAREHRGRRLGMAVKVANLQLLQSGYPERRRIETGNDGTNRFMVGINERLGFRIVELLPTYTRPLA